MITVEAKGAIEELKKNFAFLGASKLREITTVSINKTLLKARTQSAKNVLDVFNIDKPIFLKGTKIQKAKSSYGKQYGYLLADTHPLNLSNFAVQVKAFGRTTSFVGKRSGKNKGGFASTRTKTNDWGVYVEIYKGQEEHLPGAFALYFSNGNAAIVARGNDNKGIFSFTKPRKPIDGLTSKSIASMIYNPRVEKQTITEVTNMFFTETTKQLNKAVASMHKHVF